MHKSLTLKLATVIFLIGMLVSACSSLGEPTPTEVEIEIGPPESTEALTPLPTQTLRSSPTITETPPEPTLAPSPTNTLDPYHAHIAAAQEFTAKGENDSAIAEFTAAIQLDPANPLGFFERGRAYTSMGKFDEAIQDLNFAVNYDPNYAEAYNARGVAWANKGQKSQALKDFESAIELKPDMAAVYTNRGTVYIISNDYANAFLDFSKAIELLPNDPESYFNRGQAYLTAIQISSDDSYADYCIADLNQAIAMAPEASDFYFTRAMCYLVKEEFVKANLDLTQTITQDPKNAKAYLFRATLYPDYGTLDQALADVNKVLELATDSELIAQAKQMLVDIPKLPTNTPTSASTAESTATP